MTTPLCRRRFSVDYHLVKGLPKWRNWQTRQVQDLVGATPWRFESSLPHQCQERPGKPGLFAFTALAVDPARCTIRQSAAISPGVSWIATPWVMDYPLQARQYSTRRSPPAARCLVPHRIAPACPPLPRHRSCNAVEPCIRTSGHGPCSKIPRADARARVSRSTVTCLRAS